MNIQVLNILALNEYTLIQQLYNNITTKNTKAETLTSIRRLKQAETLYNNINIDSILEDNLIFLHSRIISTCIEEETQQAFLDNIYTFLCNDYSIHYNKEDYTEDKTNTNTYIENLVEITDKIFFQYIKPKQNFRTETIDRLINKLYENQTEDTIYTTKSIELYKRLFQEFNKHFVKHLYKIINIEI